MISDPEADLSAASLNVHVGGVFDKKKYGGSAHFLEHMLFMGTEKYPNVNEYSEYLADNGGSSNAYTSLVDTNYHFDVSNEGFEGAIDRFSQFFLNPLLDPAEVDKEMHAVDSEFNMSK